MEDQNTQTTPETAVIPCRALFDEPLPLWALGRLDGEYMTAGAGLATRDGRRMGNAFVYELEEHFALGTVAIVITDMGNEFKMTERELREAFYPPIWLMDCEEAKARRIASNAGALGAPATANQRKETDL